MRVWSSEEAGVKPQIPPVDWIPWSGVDGAGRRMGELWSRMVADRQDITDFLLDDGIYFTAQHNMARNVASLAPLLLHA